MQQSAVLVLAQFALYPCTISCFLPSRSYKAAILSTSCTRIWRTPKYVDLISFLNYINNYFLLLFFIFVLQFNDTSSFNFVGIETCKALEGPGVESSLGLYFSAFVQAGPVAQTAPYKWIPGLFPRGKAAGAWR